MWDTWTAKLIILFLKPPSGPNSCLWVEAKSLERCSVFLRSQTFPQASESLLGVRGTVGDLEASWLWCCQEAVTKVWFTVSRPSIHLAPARPQGTDSGERAVTAVRAARFDQVKDREAWCATVHGVAKSQIQLSDYTTATNSPSPAPFHPPQDSLPQHPWLVSLKILLISLQGWGGHRLPSTTVLEGLYFYTIMKNNVHEESLTTWGKDLQWNIKWKKSKISKYVTMGFFSPVLLRCNWQIQLYIFKVYMMIW